jgi:steroid delta-isomerase-like uncharacterized protein
MQDPIAYAGLAEDAFNRRDVDALAALWADEFVYEGPGGESTKGRELSRDRERALWQAFPDVRADLRKHTAIGNDRLLIEGVMRGSHGGTLRLGDVEIPASGRPVELHFAALFRFGPDGLVAHERVYWDRVELLQQIGALPGGAAR